MSVYGVDFVCGDEVDFLIVEADSYDEAKILAGKELNTLGLPKRNIIQIELYDWLE